MRLLVVVCLLVAVHAQKDPNVWANRSAIVHLFEWRFDDIADECENFLAPNGYAGVQTSPVHENLIVTSTDRPWWERYQPISYNIISRSGDEQAFRDMVRRCNNVGVRIYVDVILNHMTGTWDPAVGVGGSTANTNDYTYPAVPYEHSHFHPYCPVNDYNSREIVRNCELVGLHDLDQSQDYVRQHLIDFLNKLVDAGIAGYRVDAAKHMWPDDLEYIYNHVNDLNTEHGFNAGSRPFIYQEVIDWGNDIIRKFEYNHLGRVTEFRHGVQMGYAFSGQYPVAALHTFDPNWELLDSGDAFVFIDNHDNQRGHGGGSDGILTYKQPRQYRMAVAFILAHPYGYPRVMSSFDFDNSDQGPPQDADKNILHVSTNSDGSCGNGWVCEHRWHTHAAMVQFRNAVQGTEIENWWDNGNKQIAFSRGNKGFVAFAVDDGDLKQTLQTRLPAGSYCDVISGGKSNNACTGKSVTVNSDGTAYIEVLQSEENGFLAIHALSKIC